MRARTLTFLGLAALLIMPAAARAQDARERRLADDIGRQLRGYDQLTMFDDVSAEVAQGIVTLDGRVTTEPKRTEIARRIAAVDGVRDVRNRIGVLPASPVDDRLRARVARAIYGHPSFWNYAAMARPPIHIIVENGHVVLRGVVGTNVERMLARSLATGCGELSLVSELRIDGES